MVISEIGMDDDPTYYVDMTLSDFHDMVEYHRSISIAISLIATSVIRSVLRRTGECATMSEVVSASMGAVLVQQEARRVCCIAGSASG
jgi:hypothetical protein